MLPIDTCRLYLVLLLWVHYGCCMDTTHDVSNIEPDLVSQVAHGPHLTTLGHERLETVTGAALPPQSSADDGTGITGSEMENDGSGDDVTTDAEYQRRLGIISQMLHATLGKSHRLLDLLMVQQNPMPDIDSASKAYSMADMDYFSLGMSDEQADIQSNGYIERSILEYQMQQSPFIIEATGEVYFGRLRQNNMNCIMVKVLEKGTPDDYEGNARHGDAQSEIEILTNRLPWHENIVQCLGMTDVRFWLSGSDEAAAVRSVVPSLVFRYRAEETLAEYILEYIQRHPLIDHDGKSESDHGQKKTRDEATVVQLASLHSSSSKPHDASYSQVSFCPAKAHKDTYPVFPKLKNSRCIQNAIYLRDLLRALVHMKSHHVLHRGICPYSVTVFRADRHMAILGNFAFAIHVQHQSSKSDRLATDVGTAGYRAPELLKRYKMEQLEKSLQRTKPTANAMHLGTQPSAGTAESLLGNPAKWLQAEQTRLAKLGVSIQQDYSYAADVWSVAMIMIELFMGVSPFFYCGKQEGEMYSFLQNNLLAPAGTASHSHALSPYLLSVKKTMDNDDAFDMLLAMLREDPNDRPTPEALLTFAYFNCLLGHSKLA